MTLIENPKSQIATSNIEAGADVSFRSALRDLSAPVCAAGAGRKLGAGEAAPGCWAGRPFGHYRWEIADFRLVAPGVSGLRMGDLRISEYGYALYSPWKLARTWNTERQNDDRQKDETPHVSARHVFAIQTLLGAQGNEMYGQISELLIPNCR